MAVFSAPKPRKRDGDAPPRPDISHLDIEEEEPVDIRTGMQRRLLVEPLHSSWAGPPPEEDGAPRPFEVFSNVGYFPKVENRPLVPDVMLSVDVRIDPDLTKKEHLTYFQWEFGKPPDVVIEIVSNRKGKELDTRFHRYRRVRVPYFVVYDPLRLLGEATLRAFELRGDLYQPMSSPRFESLGLALVEWQGTFELHTDTWLRWCTLDGTLIPTGAERAEAERKRAEEERKRAESAEERIRRLEEMLRAQGVDPRR